MLVEEDDDTWGFLHSSSSSVFFLDGQDMASAAGGGTSDADAYDIVDLPDGTATSKEDLQMVS